MSILSTPPQNGQSMPLSIQLGSLQIFYQIQEIITNECLLAVSTPPAINEKNLKVEISHILSILVIYNRYQ